MIVHIRKADPYELLLVAVPAVAAGLRLVAAPDSTSSLLASALASALGSSWLLLGYNLAAAGAGIVVLIGCVLTEHGLRTSDRGDVRRGLLIERLGLLVTAPLMCAYGAAVLAVGPRAILVAAVSSTVGLAHLVRTRRISRDLAELRMLAAGQ